MLQEKRVKSQESPKARGVCQRAGPKKAGQAVGGSVHVGGLQGGSKVVRSLEREQGLVGIGVAPRGRRCIPHVGACGESIGQ